MFFRAYLDIFFPPLCLICGVLSPRKTAATTPAKSLLLRENRGLFS
jgi:hypothetical protein